MSKKAILKKEVLKFYFRIHGDQVRVWREDWFHDVFETMTTIEFNECMKWCKRFGIPLIEAED